MKPTALGLAIAAAAFGASTVYLSMQLHGERLRSDELATETRALNSRIAELEKARVERQFANVNPFAPLPPGAASTGRVHIEHPGVVSEGAVEDAAINVPRGHDEVFQKMMRAQVRAHHKQLYADVGAALGLSKEEAGKLIDLITDQQLAGQKSWSGSVDQKDLLRQMGEQHRQEQAQVAELLGADKAQKFEEFQQSLPARQELDMLARQLDGADTPLSDDQQKRLVALLADERKRVPAPSMSEAGSIEDFSRAYMTWQDNHEESVAAQVRSVLNSDQLATFDEYQEWQRQMRTQMGVVPVGGPSVMFATSAPAVAVDMVAAPPPRPEKRK